MIIKMTVWFTFYIHWGASHFPCTWVSNSFGSPYEADLPPLLPVRWDLQNPLKKNPSSPCRVGSWGILPLWMPIISSFPLSELTYRKGLGILEEIRGPFSSTYQSWIPLSPAIIWFLLCVRQASWHLGNTILPYSKGMSRIMSWNLDSTFTI